MTRIGDALGWFFFEVPHLMFKWMLVVFIIGGAIAWTIDKLTRSPSKK